jgi:hypothetical protein
MLSVVRPGSKQKVTYRVQRESRGLADVRQVLREAQAVGVVAEDQRDHVLQHRGLAVEGLGGLQLQQGVQGEPCAFESAIIALVMNKITLLRRQDEINTDAVSG